MKRNPHLLATQLMLGDYVKVTLQGSQHVGRIIGFAACEMIVVAIVRRDGTADKVWLPEGALKFLFRPEGK